LRVDTAGATWLTAGGFGVYYPTLQVNKFGLQSGESYRAQGRTFCDPNITAYRSPFWTSPIYWTQPGSLPIRNGGGESLGEIKLFPNPSKDIFNLTFNVNDFSEINIKVTNVLGAPIYFNSSKNHIGNFSKKIDLDNYPRGAYFLELSVDTQRYYKKMILH
jgi:hypothetical protein